MSQLGWIVGSALLLLLALAFSFAGRRSKPVAFTLGFTVLVYVVLSSMFMAADWFTGHGIDQSVLFHTMYGLDGAGFGDYSLLILSVLGLVLLGGALAIAAAALLVRARERPRALPTSRASIPVALLALALNPASGDLVQLSDTGRRLSALAHGDVAGEASFSTHYRTPSIGPDPKTRKNLVFIYAEGFERTYFDETQFPGLVTDLREVEKLGTTFTNMNQTLGTSFTMGGIVGSQCGIPLVTSSGGNSMAGMSRFLPNAVCLGDLLRSRGYHLTYMGGASLKFAGKGKFLRDHGFKETFGREQLLPMQADPSYRSGWGLHDDSLFDLAYDKFVELSSAQKHFGLFTLTLDTHAPTGYMAKSVKHVRYESGQTSILNAVAGSDKVIARFVKRIIDSPHADDTLIVLCSDHLAMENGATERLEKADRRTLFLIIDPALQRPAQVAKKGSTLDIGPTVLHALGYTASLGLGRDLLGHEPSLREQLPERHSLGAWSRELSGFWGLQQLDEITVRPADRLIDVGGTTIRAPALIAFDTDMHAEVFFEIASNRTLADYVHAFPKGKAFVWVNDCPKLAGYAADELTRSNVAGLCVLGGKRGAAPAFQYRIADKLSGGGHAEVDEDQLQAALESEPSDAIFAEQTRLLGLAQLPEGFVALINSLPPGTPFFNGKGALRPYIDAYSKEPSVVSKGILWTETLPEQSPFYFVAPVLKQVEKSGAFTTSRLALGDDLVTVMRRHSKDTVILSIKGDGRTKLSARTMQYLTRRGLDLRGLQRNGSFAAVLARTGLAQAVDNDGVVTLQSPALAQLGIDRVESAGREVGNYSKIVVNGQDISANKRGINIVILQADAGPRSLTFDPRVAERQASELFVARPKISAQADTASR